MINVVNDAFVVGFLFGLISYLSNMYGKSYPHFYKILAFVWAVPLTYFYLLLIASRNDKKAIYDFALHGLFGTILTLIIIIITLFIIDLDKNYIVFIAFLFAVISTIAYFAYDVYTI